jgi:hypothetical protein
LARRSLLKASDADREHVAERLRRATGEGRLVAEELEERLGLALTARTYGELDAVVADLPTERTKRGSTTPLWVKGTFAVAVVMAMVAVAALVALIALGLAGAWVAWVAIAWLFFGGRGRRVRRMGRSRDRAIAARPVNRGARPVNRGARVPGAGHGYL